MKYLSPATCFSTFIAVTFFLFSAASGQSNTENVDYSTMSKTELQKVLAGLELGFDSYVIGRPLTNEQQKIVQKDDGYKAHPGTVKFKDGNLFVIIDEQTKVVIAVYTRNRKATKEDFKATVGDLMLKYGEPTAEAHGKTIYWNFGADGLISEELYRSVKEQKMLDKLTILATVKFSSSESVDSMSTMIEKMEKDEKLKTSVDEPVSDNYVMIQSDLLSRKYLE